MDPAILSSRSKPMPRNRSDAGGKPPTVGVAMIVKDEEAFLGDALESTCGVVDDLVVVDTGSQDGTQDIARDFGARLFHFPWTNSFSDARNESLRHVKTDWVVILDADERLEGPAWADLRTILQTATAPAVSVNILNCRLDGTLVESIHTPRIFRGDGRFRYRGRVHNQVVFADDPSRPIRPDLHPGLHLRHFGYDPRIVAERSKIQRSYELLRLELEDDPSNLLYRWYMARELMRLGRLEESRQHHETLLPELIEAGSSIAFHCACTYAVLMRHLGAQADATDTFELLLRASPGHPEFLLTLAEAKEARGDHLAAAELAHQAVANLELEEPFPGMVRVEELSWYGRHVEGRNLMTSGRYPGALEVYRTCIERMPPQANAWSQVLTNAIALAIEAGTEADVDTLLERLIGRDDCNLGMFFFEVQRRLQTRSLEAAQTLWRWGHERTDRLPQFSDYNALSKILA